MLSYRAKLGFDMLVRVVAELLCKKKKKKKKHDHYSTSTTYW